MTAPNGNNYDGYNQQPPQLNQQYYPQPQNNGGVSGATIAAIIAAIVAVIAVAAMVIMFVTNNKSDSTDSAAGDSQFQQADANSGSGAGSGSGKKSGSSKDSAEDEDSSPVTVTETKEAPAPAPAQAGSAGSSNGHSWGDYPNYYATGPTSSPFARNVYTTFMNNWVAGGGTNVTLSVHSPTTGGTYTMYCSGSSARVTCTGGDNARVVIH